MTVRRENRNEETDRERKRDKRGSRLVKSEEREKVGNEKQNWTNEKRVFAFELV